MAWLNSERRYGALTVALHWLTLALLVVIYVWMEFRGYFPKGSDVREGMKAWHFMLRLTVPMLVALRLVARAVGQTPLITPPSAAWQRRLAGAMHIALYVFMFGMPMLGWLTLSAAGKPIPFFGLELPAVIGADKALSRQILAIHESGAILGYGIIGLHAGAALYHHYFLRDDTLQRLLP